MTRRHPARPVVVLAAAALATAGGLGLLTVSPAHGGPQEGIATPPGLVVDSPPPPVAPTLRPAIPGAPLPSPPTPPPPAAPLRPPAICGGAGPGAKPALLAAEAMALAVAAAQTFDGPATTAVVDRLGTPLAVYEQAAGAGGAAARDRAVGLARTGAFFSNDQAPLSSRTVRFVSGVHFPPGVARTPNAALYGIENTNRGCDLKVPFVSGQEVPPATSLAGGTCDFSTDAGCGTGPVTGKADDTDGNPPGRAPGPDPTAVPVDPGGLPVFRGGSGPNSLVGGLGVVLPAAAPPGAAEFAALASLLANGFVPTPAAPGQVFIDGIRLPFVEQVEAPTPPPAVPPPGAFFVTPDNGACAPVGYLVAPRDATPGGGPLTAADADRIVSQAVAAAGRTRAVIRLPIGSRARMVIAVSDLEGEILALHRMPDATIFSIDVAVAKARNVVWFSTPAGKAELPGLRPDSAVTNRTINFGSQPLFPAGIDGSGAGPFFDLFRRDFAHPCTTGFDPASVNRNGTVFFAGSIPLYVGDTLVGGLGISGDGVEQDDYVAFLGAAGFRPPERLWANRDFIRGVRMPFLKFPRNPEG